MSRLKTHPPVAAMGRLVLVTQAVQLVLGLALSLPARLVFAVEGGGGATGLHINWWGWDGHAPPVGWFIVDFVIFMFLLVHFGKRPIREAFAKRHFSIKKAIAEATDLHARAKARHDDFVAKLAGVDAEKARLLKLGHEDGERQRDATIQEAERYAERLRQDADSGVSQEIEAARARLRVQAVRDALRIAETRLRDELGDADRQVLLEAAIQELTAAADTSGAVRAGGGGRRVERVQQAAGGAA